MTKECEIGYSCGDTCIERLDQCRTDGISSQGLLKTVEKTIKASQNTKFVLRSDRSDRADIQRQFGEYEKIDLEGHVSESRLKAHKFIQRVFKKILDNPRTKVSGLYDQSGNMQAVVQYKKKQGYLFVDFLISAPWNSLESHPKKTKGAGSEVINQLAKLSEQWGFNGKIKLEATKDSKPFYEKLGFTEDSEGYMVRKNEKL